MTNTRQLKSLLRQSGYKRQYVARVLGVSTSTLRNKLNGVTDFKLAEAERLAALLALTKSQRELVFFGPQPGAYEWDALAPERRDADDNRTAQ